MRRAVFDIETRVDKRLVNETLFRGRGLDDEAAYEVLRAELLEEQGRDFVPLTFHVPIAIAFGVVDHDGTLESLESLGDPGRDEAALVRAFWTRVEAFDGGLVSFNGRGFDLPVLELAALRWGVAAPGYFDRREGRRHRFAEDAHYDLHDFLTNHGASRLRGGLDLLSRLLGLGGKGEVEGSQVQALWEAGRHEAIDRYCRRDVLQTHGLLLRVEVLRGRLSAEACAAAMEASAPLRAEHGLEPSRGTSRSFR